ncbi:unnamed protein product [Allacma fusca]|uniref:Uncharacterized protein n=1 Tax=Allacma fusca TaxID=39272 RepID=A0A8J2PJN5_9HEXA|nr:unnamed protein product [Allacma fusca]
MPRKCQWEGNVEGSYDLNAYVRITMNDERCFNSMERRSKVVFSISPSPYVDDEKKEKVFNCKGKWIRPTFRTVDKTTNY